MRDKKCRLILLVGEKHSGKTTLLQRFAERLRKENFKIAGFIAPSIYRGVFLLGFDLVDIQSGRRVKFARRGQSAESFEFSEKGLQFGRAILNSKETKRAELVIIDEFGPLELEGFGWREASDLLLSSTDCIILLVVRKEIIGKVKRLYKRYKAFEFGANKSKSIDKVVKILENRKRNRDKQMENEQIQKQLKRFAGNGQISCKQCFKIAGELDVSLKRVGDACNKKIIKIRSCQLGCFK